MNRTGHDVPAEDSRMSRKRMTSGITVFTQLMCLVVTVISVCALLALLRQKRRLMLDTANHREHGTSHSSQAQASRAPQTESLLVTMPLASLSHTLTQPSDPYSRGSPDGYQPGHCLEAASGTAKPALAPPAPGVSSTRLAVPHQTAETSGTSSPSALSSGQVKVISVSDHSLIARNDNAIPAGSLRQAPVLTGQLGSSRETGHSSPGRADPPARRSRLAPVALITQQRTQRVGKMVVILSLILFTAYLPGTVLTIIFTAISRRSTWKSLLREL
ncbi:hypothetical protein RRG08_049348 [Elysia crispata]|uniref:Uncharacterized protein n=1 Tax=Elysia crispata TaxID=231223 RepID=A0AAE0XEE6_9GAST|nr:hypothetical protein RRG08_049348 [Elysia crispata]